MSGVALNYRFEGPDGAPVLVLGNSLGAGMAMWDPVAGLLQHEFRILGYDHRGQGDSRVVEGPYLVSDLGRDLLDLLDLLDLNQVAYAGVSIGGMVGLWLAANAPERVSSVATFCSSAYPGDPDPDVWRQRSATVRDAGSVAPIAEQVLTRWLTPAYAAAHPDLHDRLLAMLENSPAVGYAALCDMLAELDLRADLNAVTVPVLVVAGAQDEALPPAHSEVIAAGISGARYELLDPSAHIPMLERPEDVAGLIRASAGAS